MSRQRYEPSDAQLLDAVRELLGFDPLPKGHPRPSQAERFRSFNRRLARYWHEQASEAQQ